MVAQADKQTGKLQIPTRDKYVPPPVHSPEWCEELRRASEECRILLWGMAQFGRFKDADEMQAVAKALKMAMDLQRLAEEKLSQTGYNV